MPLSPPLTGAEIGFILNSVWFLLMGLLGLMTILGLMCKEYSMLSPRGVAAAGVKHLICLAAAILAFYLIGYHLLFGGPETTSFLPYFTPDEKDAVELNQFKSAYTKASDWFYQLGFAVLGVFIFSGTIGVRIRPWAYGILAVLYAGLLYPTIAGWQWGGGFLSQQGFFDFGGASLAHGTAAWAAFAATLLFGPRAGRFKEGRKANNYPRIVFPPLLLCGTLLFWFGMLGLLAGGQLSIATVPDTADLSMILVNAPLASAGGIFASFLLCALFYPRKWLHHLVAGGIAGLVAIAAEPITPAPYIALAIGAAAGVLAVFITELLAELKIDDVSLNLAPHLAGGLLGTMAVPLTNPEASFISQAIGVSVIAATAFFTSFIAIFILNRLVNVRLTKPSQLPM